MSNLDTKDVMQFDAMFSWCFLEPFYTLHTFNPILFGFSVLEQDGCRVGQEQSLAAGCRANGETTESRIPSKDVSGTENTGMLVWFSVVSRHSEPNPHLCMANPKP